MFVDNLDDVIQQRKGLNSLDAILPLLLAETADASHTNRGDDLSGRVQDKIQARHFLLQLFGRRHTVRIGRGDLVLAAEHGAGFIDHCRTEGCRKAQSENLIDGAVGLRPGDAGLRLCRGSIPGITVVGVVAGIKEPFAKEFVLVRHLVVNFDRNIVSCLAASHCADEIVTSISATARTLLQRINEIRVGVACEIERGQRIDLALRNDGREEGSPVELAVSIRSGGRVRVVKAVGRSVHSADRREPGIAGEVSIPFCGQRDCQDCGFVLVKQRDVPRGEEKRTVLAVVKVRKIDRPSQGSTEVVKVNLRL